MVRTALVLSSILVLGAAVAGCSPAGRDKAKEEGQEAASKMASVARTAASEAKNAVETAASDHGIGVKSTPDFIQAAAMGDMFEIRSSELALKVSKDPAVKRFARHMIADHTRLSREMKAAVTQSGNAASLPTDLNSDLQGKLDDLKKADPKDFDHKYLDDQRGGHEAAAGMFKAYGDSGSDPTIKAAAAAALPIIQGHLDEVKALQKAQDKAKSSNQ